MLAQKLLSGGGEEKIYVDDVFSAFTYTGNGSAQTITNGIDLAGKGGLVWIKGRSGATSHRIFDTDRTATKYLMSNSTNGQATDTNTLDSFNSDGFHIQSAGEINTSAATYVAHSFRKAPKFFDVVTYTGDGVANRMINHSLGSIPGMYVLKATSTAGDDWIVKHRSIGTGEILRLNTTDIAGASSTASGWATSTQFSVHNKNSNGTTYVAYLFAHDTSAD